MQGLNFYLIVNKLNISAITTALSVTTMTQLTLAYVLLIIGIR